MYKVVSSHWRTNVFSIVYLEHGMFYVSENERRFGFNCRAVCGRHDYYHPFIWTEGTRVDDEWLMSSWLWCPGCAELGIKRGIDVPSSWFVEDAGVW